MAVFGQFAMIAVSGTDRNFLEPLASPAMRTALPVVPHKAVAEVSKIGNL